MTYLQPWLAIHLNCVALQTGTLLSETLYVKHQMNTKATILSAIETLKSYLLKQIQ